MEIDEQRESWTLCATKNKGTYRGGEARDDTCDHGLSRRSPRVKHLLRVTSYNRLEIRTRFWFVTCDC